MRVGFKMEKKNLDNFWHKFRVNPSKIDSLNKREDKRGKEIVQGVNLFWITI